MSPSTRQVHDGSESEEEPIALTRASRQRNERREVDPTNILPETSRRPRKSSRKQKEIDETDKEKYIKQLEKQVKRYKTQEKKAARQPQSTARDPADVQEDSSLSDLSCESEERDSDHAPMFRSVGVIDTAPKKKLVRQSARLSESIESSSRDRLDRDLSGRTSPSTMGPASSRASSAMSIYPSSRSPSNTSRATSPPRSPSPTEQEQPSVQHATHRERSFSPSNYRPYHGAYVYEKRTSRRISQDRGRSPAPHRPENSNVLPSPLPPSAADHTQSRHRHTSRSRSRSSVEPSTKRPRLHSPSATTTKARPTNSSTQLPITTIHYKTRDGKIPTRGKPSESEYSDQEKVLVKKAIKEYLVNIIVVDAFPSDELSLRWASAAWTEVCSVAERRYSDEDNERVMRLIRNRASTARGHLRDEFRDLVVSEFKLHRETTRTQVRKDNEDRVRWLKDGQPPRYAYKSYDLAKPQFYAEARFLLRGLQSHLFKHSHSLGTVYLSSFDPLPIPTLALLLTTTEFCIDCWASGEFNEKLRFEESIYRDRYIKHLEQLRAWEKLDTNLVTKLRQNMFKRICTMGKIAGSEPQKSEVLGLSKEAEERARKDLEGRTGDTDSEDEARSSVPAAS